MELKNNDIKDYLDLTDKLEPNVILETVKFIQDTQSLTDKEKKEISIFLITTATHKKKQRLITLLFFIILLSF